MIIDHQYLKPIINKLTPERNNIISLVSIQTHLLFTQKSLLIL